MSTKKCSKVKNPCKICLGAVTQKTGLQCQGACQCWVHYTCLNYTPGKIKDIKAGIIKVTCPCPDCKTSQPKEYRTDTGYSCNNSMCPANIPPKCENQKCPINNLGYPVGPPQGFGPSPCALNKCAKNDCKQYSSPCSADGPQAPQGRLNGGTAPKTSMPPKLDPCNANPTNPKCSSGCSSKNDMSGDFGLYQQRTGGAGGGQMPPMHVVEQMCNTVGQLTNQIQQLMMQMKKAVNDGPRPGPHQPPQCPPHPPIQTAQKPTCPKPCFCPGNPGRRS